jgi:hypothetical protein
LFAQHDSAFILARFPTYGCYALRIEARTTASPPATA